MKEKKQVHYAGKRKRAIARATIKKGSGKIFVNRVPLDNIEPKLTRIKIREVLFLAPADVVEKVDIIVRTSGGGIMSQADSVRLAIARALAGYTKGDTLERDYLKYDRHLLVADVRRKEVRKPNRCGKARAKRQKSYR